MSAVFTVPGPPVTWKRPQQGRNGGRFTDARHEAQADAVARMAEAARLELAPIPTPISLYVVVYLPVPKTVGYPPLPVGKTTGDHDNYKKLVADALEGIAYENDSQIIDGRELKLWAPADPYTEIHVGPCGTVQPLELDFVTA